MRTSKIKSRLQHNPPSDIPKVLKKIPEGLTANDKCKLYVVVRPSNNHRTPVNVYHGVKLKNIDRVLSKITLSSQRSAFFVTSNTNRTFKLFNN